jgi:hypothetical protein
MSKIKVNSLVNKNEDGAVEFTRGAVIPSGQELKVNGNVNISGIATISNINVTNANISGVITATSFVGDGSNLTNLPTVSSGKIIAYKRILGYDEYRS